MSSKYSDVLALAVEAARTFSQFRRIGLLDEPENKELITDICKTTLASETILKSGRKLPKKVECLLAEAPGWLRSHSGKTVAKNHDNNSASLEHLLKRQTNPEEKVENSKEGEKKSPKRKQESWILPDAVLRDAGYTIDVIARARAEIMKKTSTDELLIKYSRRMGRGYRYDDTRAVRQYFVSVAKKAEKALNSSKGKIDGIEELATTGKNKSIGIKQLLLAIGVETNQTTSAIQYFLWYFEKNPRNYLATVISGKSGKLFPDTAEVRDAAILIADEGEYLQTPDEPEPAALTKENYTYITVGDLIKKLRVPKDKTMKAIASLSQRVADSEFLEGFVDFGNNSQIKYADTPKVIQAIKGFWASHGYLPKTDDFYEKPNAPGRKKLGASEGLEKEIAKYVKLGIPENYVLFDPDKIAGSFDVEIPKRFIVSIQDSVLHVIKGSDKKLYYDHVNHGLIKQVWDASIGADWRASTKYQD